MLCNLLRRVLQTSGCQPFLYWCTLLNLLEKLCTFAMH